MSRRSRKGFTLIELLVVVAVLALLASIVFSNLGGAREGARISNALQFQSQMHNLLGSDLVGWWNFNDPDSRYKDISGYGNNGSCISCPTAVDGVPGTGGTAMEFNGGSEYVNLGDAVDLNFILGGTKELTISGWVKTDSIAGNEMWIGSHNPTGQRIYLAKMGGYWDMGIAGNAWGSGHSGTRENVTLDWTHYLVTFNQGETLLYINSEETITKSYTSIDVEGSIPVGAGYTGSYGYFFNGLIDDVRIYSRALTASEVQGIYAQTKGNYVVK